MKTTLSVPTPDYFTSFRISVDSTPDAGKALTQAHDTLTWTTMVGNPPAGAAQAPSVSPTPLPSGPVNIYVYLSR